MGFYPTLVSLAEGFCARGDRTAIVALRGEEVERWSYAELAATIARLAAGLVRAGLGPGEPVAILAPARPEWVVTYFAIVAAGALPVPIDETFIDGELEAVIAHAGCRRVFTVEAHLERLRALGPGADLDLILLDGAKEGAGGGRSWRSLLAGAVAPLSAIGAPHIDPDDPASLLYTSGTTGTPKGVPLTHRNFLSNLEALLAAGLVGPDDRVAVPLPLHHAYPFTAGVLGALGSGAALVLPAALTGPRIVQALKLGRATAMVGVPRLYGAMVDGIEAKVAARGLLARLAFRALLALSTALHRHFGLRAGRLLFRQLHRELAPDLRLMGSGGAHLDPEVAAKLEALGWEVLSGYGLTETAPILTFNPRGRARQETTGVPVAGVELRIAAAPGSDQGEIQARGPNVFAGYRDNPEATRAAFTDDGWFRTGDLGFLDADGYLHIVGRTKEMIVLSDGKNIFPEEIEAAYGESPYIREAAVFESGGRLTGLVVPDIDALRARGESHVETLLREEIETISLRLPPHKRLSGFALAREPLPRTNLGKLRRFLLPEIYARAKAGAGPARPAALSEEDRALLASHPAKEIWEWLVARYPDKPVTLAASPQLDIGIDSLEWVSLGLEMKERFAIVLTEDMVARVTTLRDFLEQAVAAAAGPAPGTALGMADLSAEQAQWLKPPGPFVVVLRAVLHGLERLLVRALLRVRVEGADNVPSSGPFVLAPNHTSYLDPFVLAAAIPWNRFRRIYWAGWTGVILTGPRGRRLSRMAQVFPVDPLASPAAGLAYGIAVLARGQGLVWFPEGRRSPSGRLLTFLPGVGALVAETGALAVPVRIRGTFEAWPTNRRLPRLRPVHVIFGRPLTPAELEAAGEGTDAPTRITDALQKAVAALAPADGPAKL